MILLRNIHIEQTVAPTTFTTTLDFTSVTGTGWVLKNGDAGGGSPGSTIPSKIYTVGPQSVGYDYGNVFLWLESTTGFPFDTIFGAGNQASVFCGTNGDSTGRAIAYGGMVRLQISFNNQGSTNTTMLYQGSVNPPTSAPLPAGWVSQATNQTFNFGEDLDAFTNKGDVWMRKDSNLRGAGQSIDFSSDPESTLGNLKLYFTNGDVDGQPGYTHFSNAHTSPYYLCLYADANNYAVIDVTSLTQVGTSTSYLGLNWDYVRGVGSVSGELEAIGFVETDFGT